MSSEMREDQKEATLISPLSEETSLRRALELINSLISSSYSILSFPAKWQLIRDKLEQLNSNLAAAADGNFSIDNSVLAAFLEPMITTLNDIQMLADRCSDESYSGGKLLMQSNLDAISPRLELIIKHLTQVYASAILSQSQAILLAKPTVDASREDMRFYVKDLFSRLRIGDLDMRSQALTILKEILHEDEKYVRIVVLETAADSISLLVNFLEHGDMGIQEKAAGAVSVIANFDSYKGALVTGGAIAPLVQALEMGSEVGKEEAARALRKLTKNSDNAWSVAAHGGVTVLLKLCSNADSSGELIGLACNTLRNLSSVEEIKKFMMEQGVVSVFTKLLKSKEEAIEIHATELLYAMALDDDILRHMVVGEGVIEPLMKLLDPNSPRSLKVREVALQAAELFFSSTDLISALIGCGFLDRVLFLLKNGEISIQESGLKVVSHLCEISEEAKKAMGDAGFLAELVKLLDARSFEVRELAAEVLCCMVPIQQNCKRFIQDDDNVNQIMRLLNPDEEKSITKKLLLSILMSLADSISGRRKILASGYMNHLEKLAEADVLDAKKIIKRLSCNRFRSILSRIWSM